MGLYLSLSAGKGAGKNVFVGFFVLFVTFLHIVTDFQFLLFFCSFNILRTYFTYFFCIYHGWGVWGMGVQRSGKQRTGDGSTTPRGPSRPPQGEAGGRGRSVF